MSVGRDLRARTVTEVTGSPRSPTKITPTETRDGSIPTTRKGLSVKVVSGNRVTGLGEEVGVGVVGGEGGLSVRGVGRTRGVVSEKRQRDFWSIVKEQPSKTKVKSPPGQGVVLLLPKHVLTRGPETRRVPERGT